MARIYTHLHRGNPPMSDKYIATGWWQGNIGLQQVNTAGILDNQYNESLNAYTMSSIHILFPTPVYQSVLDFRPSES